MQKETCLPVYLGICCLYLSSLALPCIDLTRHSFGCVPMFGKLSKTSYTAGKQCLTFPSSPRPSFERQVHLTRQLLDANGVFYIDLTCHSFGCVPMPGKLSKTSFTYGKQCLKRLYLHRNHKKFGVERDALSVLGESIFAMGTEVGKLAQQYFPGGIDMSGLPFEESIVQTQQIVTRNIPGAVYEAAFLANDVFAALDILVLRLDGWHCYEVKSSTCIKDQYITDAAIQQWVVQRSGLKLCSMNLLFLNKDFKKTSNDVDLAQLFVCQDITDQTDALQTMISDDVKAQLECLDIETIPDINIGSHCTKPYPCDFRGSCYKGAGVPEYSVLNIRRAGAKKWDWFHRGMRLVLLIWFFISPKMLKDPESVLYSHLVLRPLI
jgi:hypothetical protein